MPTNKRPESLSVQPGKKAKFEYKKRKKAVKVPGVLEIYEDSSIAGVMNLLTLTIFVLGSMLVMWAEVSRSEKIFSETEKSFAKSEILSDKLSIHNRVAYGDLVLPEEGSETVAQSGSTVLGASVSDTDVDETTEPVTDEVDLEVDEITSEEETQPEFDDSSSAEVEEILAKIEMTEDEQKIEELSFEFEERTTDATPEFSFDYDSEVSFSINEGDFQVVESSPFTADELDLGDHSIDVKYINDSGEQVLGVSVEVIPDSPKISPITPDSITKEGFVKVSGTTVAGATVRVFVASELQTGEVVADKDGKWTFETKKALEAGSHTVMAQTIVDGVVSDMSDTITFEVSGDELPETGTTGTLGQFEISPNVLLMILGALVGGIVLAVIWMKVFVVNQEPELKISHDGAIRPHDIKDLKKTVKAKSVAFDEDNQTEGDEGAAEEKSTEEQPEGPGKCTSCGSEDCHCGESCQACGNDPCTCGDEPKKANKKNKKKEKKIEEKTSDKDRRTSVPVGVTLL